MASTGWMPGRHSAARVSAVRCSGARRPAPPKEFRSAFRPGSPRESRDRRASARVPHLHAYSRASMRAPAPLHTRPVSRLPAPLPGALVEQQSAELGVSPSRSVLWGSTPRPLVRQQDSGSKVNVPASARQLSGADQKKPRKELLTGGRGADCRRPCKATGSGMGEEQTAIRSHQPHPHLGTTGPVSGPRPVPHVPPELRGSDVKVIPPPRVRLFLLRVKASCWGCGSLAKGLGTASPCPCLPPSMASLGSLDPAQSLTSCPRTKALTLKGCLLQLGEPGLSAHDHGSP